MNFDTIMARGMAKMNAVAGEVIVIDGVEYTAVVNRFMVTREMVQAGFNPGYNLTTVLSLAQMPVLPPFDADSIYGTYRGKQMQIMHGDSDSAGHTLYLKEVR